MRLNNAKTKFKIFNRTINFDFLPDYEIDGKQLETVDEMKLLGVTITSDMKWKANTDNLRSELL